VRRHLRWSIVLSAVLALVAAALPASAEHATRPHTPNIHAKGHSPHPAQFLGVPSIEQHVNSDLAFQGRLAFNGNYDGWRVIDISDPDNPTELAHPSCKGDQGDIVVWGNILVRSWNTKRPEARPCVGETVPINWEGVHVFDISDPTNPTLEAAVELPCGSHTASAAGVDDGALIVYSNISSSVGCGTPGNTRAEQDALGDFMDVIAVPLNNLAGASLIHREPLAGPTDPLVRTGCHDVGVILGDVNKAACASADTINVFDVSNPRDPSLLFTITEPGVGDSTTNGRWHSAAFTWDGEVIIAGWEPGGGAAPECETTDPPVDKSMFFYDADTGVKLGMWTLPRGQDAPNENCTIHNYNLVPLRSGRYIAVSGNYQAGTWVTDLTNPASAVTVAWSDPPVLSPPDLGGAWSTYWYNGFLYESEITKGLNVFRVSDPRLRGEIRLGRLNPQTQETSM
jgi:hypothetical protein